MDKPDCTKVTVRECDRCKGDRSVCDRYRRAIMNLIREWVI